MKKFDIYRSPFTEAFQCGQLENYNVDGEHFIRFRVENAVSKFIGLSVDAASALKH